MLTAAERYYYESHKACPSLVRHPRIILEMEGRVDLYALMRALTHISYRHASLRTTFHSTQIPATARHIVRCIAEEPNAQRVAIIDRQHSRGLTDSGQQFLHEREHTRTFDLAQGPLAIFSLDLIKPDHLYLSLTFHHIVADGWSLHVILREVADYYSRLSADPTSLTRDTPDALGSYIAYALAENERRHARMAPLTASLPRLAWMHPRPARTITERTAANSCISTPFEFRCPPPNGCEYSGTSHINNVILAAFVLALCDVGGVSAILLINLISLRRAAQHQDIVACMTTPVLGLYQAQGELSPSQFLEQVRRTTIMTALRSYEDVDQRLQAICKETREFDDYWGNTAFPTVAFNLLNTQNNVGPVSDLLPGVACRQVPDSATRPMRFDIGLWVRTQEPRVYGRVEGNPAGTDPAELSRIRHLVEKYCLALSAEPPRTINRLRATQ